MGTAGNLEVSLPGWFYQHGFFTAGMGKIFQCEKKPFSILCFAVSLTGKWIAV